MCYLAAIAVRSMRIPLELTSMQTQAVCYPRIILYIAQIIAFAQQNPRRMVQIGTLCKYIFFPLDQPCLSLALGLQVQSDTGLILPGCHVYIGFVMQYTSINVCVCCVCVYLGVYTRQAGKTD